MDIKRRAKPLLGTFVEVSVPLAHAAAAADAFEAVRRVDEVMSFHRQDSDVSRINRAGAGDIVQCDPSTVVVLELAKRLYEITGGRFDICIAPRLVQSGYLPADAAVCLTRFDGSSPDDIEILEDNRVRLRRPVMIDLGGLAKGHAVDRAIECLHGQGVPSAMVNAGGDLRHYGEKPWRVHLRNADGTLGEVMSLRPCAIASSLNSLTRKHGPAGTDTPHIGPDGRTVLIDRTISVLARRCVLADAMTKVAMTDRCLADRLLAEEGGYVLGPAMERPKVPA